MKSEASRGFTLIELLVVISIIGLLSSVVLASLSTARQKARQAVRMQDMRSIYTALVGYYAANGAYPKTCGWSSLYPEPTWAWPAGKMWNGTDCSTNISTPNTNWIPELVTSGWFKTLPSEPTKNTVAGSGPMYMYRSDDGIEYKLIAHYVNYDGACQGIPTNLIDPVRAGLTPATTCWAYGYWSSGLGATY